MLTPISAREKIAALEDEVRRLKRELAGRGPKDIEREVLPAPLSKADAGPVCMHGSRNCGKLYCKSQR